MMNRRRVLGGLMATAVLRHPRPAGAEWPPETMRLRIIRELRKELRA